MSANGLHRIRRRKSPSDSSHFIAQETYRLAQRRRWKMSANGLHRIRWRWVVLIRPHRTRRLSACETLRKLYSLMAEITTFILHVAFVSPHGLKNDECYMCRALVSPHGYKNDVHFMCSAFVSPNGLKNDESHICSALVSRHGFKTTNVTCVARLFRLMAERYFLSLAN